jgi:hypothetical protein
MESRAAISPQVISDREECAYIVGVFLGAKLAGASNEKLNALRRNLVL